MDAILRRQHRVNARKQGTKCKRCEIRVRNRVHAALLRGNTLLYNCVEDSMYGLYEAFLDFAKISVIVHRA